jgi:hypothetical protein
LAIHSCERAPVAGRYRQLRGIGASSRAIMFQTVLIGFPADGRQQLERAL